MLLKQITGYHWLIQNAGLGTDDDYYARRCQQGGRIKATVSRVLAGNNYVSKTTRDRVFKAIEETGYRPNLLARNLATSSSQSIGLMVSNTLYNGPYFTELLFQTATLTESYGRQLLLVDGKHSAEEERQAIEFLLDLRCDGIIVYPRFLDADRLTDIINSSPKPIIALNRQLENSPCTASMPIISNTVLTRSAT